MKHIQFLQSQNPGIGSDWLWDLGIGNRTREQFFDKEVKVKNQVIAYNMIGWFL